MAGSPLSIWLDVRSKAVLSLFLIHEIPSWSLFSEASKLFVWNYQKVFFSIKRHSDLLTFLWTTELMFGESTSSQYFGVLFSVIYDCKISRTFDLIAFGNLFFSVSLNLFRNLRSCWNFTKNFLLIAKVVLAFVLFVSLSANCKKSSQSIEVSDNNKC